MARKRLLKTRLDREGMHLEMTVEEVAQLARELGLHQIAVEVKTGAHRGGQHPEHRVDLMLRNEGGPFPTEREGLLRLRKVTRAEVDTFVREHSRGEVRRFLVEVARITLPEHIWKEYPRLGKQADKRLNEARDRLGLKDQREPESPSTQTLLTQAQRRTR